MADNNQQIEDIDSMDVQTLLNIATHNNAVSYMAQSALMLAGKAHFDDWLLRPAYGQSNRTLAEAGENKTDLFAFDIYPNPANSEFIIQLPNPELVSKIYIINNIGVTVMEYNENSLQKYNTIEANRLTNGIYLIRVINKDGFSCSRPVVITN